MITIERANARRSRYQLDIRRRTLRNAGYALTALDVAGSGYGSNRVYDGRHILYSGASFDVVFSSNLLERIDDPGHLLAEKRRVLVWIILCRGDLIGAVWTSCGIESTRHFLPDLEAGTG